MRKERNSPDLKEQLGPKTEPVFIPWREFNSVGLSYNVFKEDS
ncbi:MULTISPECIES: hypothetical protein [Paenibacillus]|nr:MULTISPECIES: hypothetical protein [Paenibacillus]MEC0253874.1 hypothetical protein [Paenibacillus lautus]